MTTIYKYHLNKGASTTVGMPFNAKILTANYQNGEIVVWALVNPENAVEYIKFEVHMTGGVLKEDLEYINTVQDNIGLVWHIFKDR